MDVEIGPALTLEAFCTDNEFDSPVLSWADPKCALALAQLLLCIWAGQGSGVNAEVTMCFTYLLYISWSPVGPLRSAPVLWLMKLLPIHWKLHSS